MSEYYPIMLRLNGRRCVVVGGGEVAERKVKTFLECGAAVCVISPDLGPGLRDLANKGDIEVVSRRYQKGDLKGALIAVAATDDAEVNRDVFEEGQEAGVLVNVVDDPKNSVFIVPSILRRGDIVISVSTSGRSPALARRIREDLEQRYGLEYAALVALISEVRSELKERGKQVDRESWEKGLKLAPLLELLKKGDGEGAKRRLLMELEKDWPHP